MPTLSSHSRGGKGCCADCEPLAAVLLSSGRYSFKLPLLSIESLGGIGWSFELDYLAGNTINYTYDTALIFGGGAVYQPRLGLLMSETRLYNNSISIPLVPASRSTISNGQYQLSRTYFYEPIFNQLCATVEERGNPIELGSPNTYFTPQNGITTPTDTDHSAYATVTYYDYQKDALATVDSDPVLQGLLGLTSTQIDTLIAYVNTQMTTVGPIGGLPLGLQMDLGCINGDGTGSGAGSGLPNATHLGNVVAVIKPKATLFISPLPANLNRIESFTSNLRGQTTTHTDAEGNVTAYVRYPLSNPDGSGQYIVPKDADQQYGFLQEVHVDVDPVNVLSLVALDGAILDFNPALVPSSPVNFRIPRTNTPDVYQDLVTAYNAYDGMGHILAMTDPRGFTSFTERTELGEVYRTTSPAPYSFRVETSYDANRNVVQVDTQDQQPLFNSSDTTDACFARFTPGGSGSTAYVPMQSGPGGSSRPGWFRNTFDFDILDDKIQDNIDAAGSFPDVLVTMYQYDPNQNLIQVVKPEGNVVAYDYEERNLRIAEYVGPLDPTFTSGAITITAYDGNANVMQVVGPIQRGTSLNSQTITINNVFGTSGPLTQTGDFVLENTYDGFDRVVIKTDAVGDVVESVFDPGNREIETTYFGPVGGAFPTDRTGSTNVKLAQTSQLFDEAGRLYETLRDVSLGTGTTLPSGRAVTHTGGGLTTNSATPTHTGTVTLTTGGDSYVLTRTIYDRANRTTAVLEDNTAMSTTVYDGASRAIQTTDALGNVVLNTFDALGNVILSSRVEVCTITAPTVTNEIFSMYRFYDSLNRLIVQSDQGADGSLMPTPPTCGSTSTSQTKVSVFGYDSRGNQVVTIDPNGDSTLTVFDGASRDIQTQQILKEVSPLTNSAMTGQTFQQSMVTPLPTTRILDGNGRLTVLTDARGNSTFFDYDDLERMVTLMFPDGSTRTNVYDLANDVVTYFDENGSEFDNTFDPLGRKFAVNITPAGSIGGTTSQAFQYDGMSRMTLAQDVVGANTAGVTLVYDSLSRLLEDSQSYLALTRNVTNNAFTSYPATGFTFPTGTRQLINSFDLLYRRGQVQDAAGPSNIAQWQFFGPGRLAEVLLGNGLYCTWMNDTRTHSAVQLLVPTPVANPVWGTQSSDRLGYDGAGQPITKRYLKGGLSGTSYANTLSVVGVTTAYDLSGNKYYERELHAADRSHLYIPYDTNPNGGYDSLNRLLQYQRGVLNSTGGFGGNGGGSLASTTLLPNTFQARNYVLDGVGNWQQSIFTPEGSTQQIEKRVHNNVNETLKRVNVTTSVVTNLQYDGVLGASNGNLANDGTLSYSYDALNRLLQVANTTGSTIYGQYVYDAFNRRIQKIIPNLGGGFGGITGDIPAGTTDCLYDGWRCVEERDSTNTATMQYVWGIYLDECLQVLNIAGINNFPVNSALYPMQDLLYRTIGLSDSAGIVREAYDTDAYGNTLVFRYAGSPPAPIKFIDADTQAHFPTCPFIFTGQRYDAESQIYYYKRRYYAPVLGRFLSKDSKRNIKSFKNLFQYASHQPLRRLDQSGAADFEVTLVHINEVPAGNSRSNPVVLPADHSQMTFSFTATGKGAPQRFWWTVFEKDLLFDDELWKEVEAHTGNGEGPDGNWSVTIGFYLFLTQPNNYVAGPHEDSGETHPDEIMVLLETFWGSDLGRSDNMLFAAVSVP